MVKLSFEFHGERLERSLAELPRDLHQKIGAVIHRGAAKGEIHLKNDAPWTDRTGAARSGLHTLAETGGNSFEILFSHTVDYGIWLEVKNSGKYQVIMPTVLKTGKEIMSDLNGIL